MKQEMTWKRNSFDWHMDDHIRKHDATHTFRFGRETRSKLKSWFDFLDEDGSGEIEIAELSDPLLSTGLVANHRELAELFTFIDTDGSGDIDIWEFMSALKPTNMAKAQMTMQAAAGQPVPGLDKPGEQASSAAPEPGDDGSSVLGSKPGTAKPSKAEPSTPAFDPAEPISPDRVLEVAELRARFLPSDGHTNNSRMNSLLELIQGGDQVLAVPTKLTAERRRFLMTMIVEQQELEVSARREMQKALQDAQRRGDHATILRLRNLQRERNAVQARRNERMRALRVIINKKIKERELLTGTPSTPKSPAELVHQPLNEQLQANLDQLKELFQGEESFGLSPFANLANAVARADDDAARKRVRHDDTVQEASRPTTGTTHMGSRPGTVDTSSSIGGEGLTGTRPGSVAQGVAHGTGEAGAAAAESAADEIRAALFGTKQRAGKNSSFAQLEAEAAAESLRSRSVVYRKRRMERWAVHSTVPGEVIGGTMAEIARVLAGKLAR